MTNPDGLKGIRFIGFIPEEGVEVREYRDYIRHISEMPRREFETQLKDGTLPPGLVILPDGMVPGVVVGRGERQGVRKLDWSKGVRI